MAEPEAHGYCKATLSGNSRFTSPAGNYGGSGGATQPEGMASGLAVAQEKLEGLRAVLDEARAVRRDAGNLCSPVPLQPSGACLIRVVFI